MMNGMRNQMLLAAQMANAGRASTRIGVVTSFDPGSYSAVVKLQPEGSLTGWLPIVSPWVGNGWGLFSPPSIRDLVEVQFQEDNIEAGFVCQRFYNDADRPLSVESGEFWLVHQSGSLLKFHNDGTVNLVAAGTLTSSAPQWNHTGPVNITGTLHATDNITTDKNVTATFDISDHSNKSMAGMRTAYNIHTHTDPQGGSVSTPSTSM